MTVKELETRVQQLEAQMVELQRTLLTEGSRPKDWRAAVEKYAGDEDVLHVIREGIKVREADRARARKKFARKPRKKTA